MNVYDTTTKMRAMRAQRLHREQVEELTYNSPLEFVGGILMALGITGGFISLGSLPDAIFSGYLPFVLCILGISVMLGYIGNRIETAVQQKMEAQK